jgi:hypothetical protein
LARTRRAVRPDEWLDGLGNDLWDEPARGRLEILLWAKEILAVGTSVILEWPGGAGREAASRLADGRRRRAQRARRVARRAAASPGAAQRLDPAWHEAVHPAGVEEWARLFEFPDAAERAFFDL